jgi:Flp pilus assembly protein TadB
VYLDIENFFGCKSGVLHGEGLLRMRSAGRTRLLVREAYAFVGLLARLTKCGVPLPQAIEIASK